MTEDSVLILCGHIADRIAALQVQLDGPRTGKATRDNLVGRIEELDWVLGRLARIDGVTQ